MPGSCGYRPTKLPTRETCRPRPRLPYGGAGPPRGPLASAEPAFHRPSRSLRREERHGPELQYRPHLIDGCLAATGLAIEAR